MFFFYCMAKGTRSETCIIDRGSDVPLSGMCVYLGSEEIVTVDSRGKIFSLRGCSSLSLGSALCFSRVGCLRGGLSCNSLVGGEYAIFLGRGGQILRRMSVFDGERLGHFLRCRVLSPLGEKICSFTSILMSKRVCVMKKDASYNPFRDGVHSALF